MASRAAAVFAMSAIEAAPTSRPTRSNEGPVVGAPRRSDPPPRLYVRLSLPVLPIGTPSRSVPAPPCCAVAPPPPETGGAGGVPASVGNRRPERGGGASTGTGGRGPRFVSSIGAGGSAFPLLIARLYAAFLAAAAAAARLASSAALSARARSSPFHPNSVAARFSAAARSRMACSVSRCPMRLFIPSEKACEMLPPGALRPPIRRVDVGS